MTGDISSEQFARALEQRCGEVVDPRVGLFGPESMMWRVSRHAGLFLGSWRAALLQLAHPWVAHAIDQHSTTMQDPIARFHRTFRVMFSMVFGSTEQARAVSEALHRQHGGIVGKLNEAEGSWGEGSSYSANNAEAMHWVNATLWDSSIRMYERLCGPLSDAEREQYYREARTIAPLFGLDPTELPDDWAGFQRWFIAWCGSDALHVGSTAKRLGEFLFDVDLPLRGFWKPRARRITALVMPEPLRHGFGLPDDAVSLARAERDLIWARRVYRCLPRRVKYVPPWFEAQRRITGKASAGKLTRCASRLWIGQPQLVFDQVSARSSATTSNRAGR